jgi:HAD superfamily hydrolase (TIGR01549 family)
MVRGVLVDIDGTMLLSNDLHAHSWVEAFAAHGYDIPYEDVRPLIGMGGDKLITKLRPELNDESGPGKEISNTRKKLLMEKYMSQFQAAPGSRELVERLLRDGYKLVVATSAEEEELEDLLKASRIADLLEEKTTSSDAEQSKPDPDIVQAALDKTGFPPEQVLMLGDTPYDVQAAQHCGIGLVAVRCGGWSDADLAGAVAIYDDPADLLNNYDTSPFARNSVLNT